MIQTLLDDQARALLEEEREVLRRLLSLLERLGGDDDVIGPLSDMIQRLDDLFLVVIVGEFNAGKSSVVNALFRETVMEEGPVPTTAKITLIRYGDTPLTRQTSEFVEEKQIQNPLLQNLTLVDTPGTNSIVRQHQQITQHFVPRSDLVLFVTSFDRPLTESERQFLSYIRDDWGRELVVVLNKADLADSEKDLTTVISYLETNLEEILGSTPTIFPVSAKAAIRAHASRDLAGPDAELWERSRFADFETFLTETLAGPERVRLKLEAPIETARTRLRRLIEHVDDRKDLLAEDEETLADLRETVESSRDDLQNSFGRPLKRIDEKMARMKGRGVQFLEDTIRASVSKIQLMRDRDRLKSQFRDRVTADVEQDIKDAVSDAVDGLMAETSRLQSELVQTFSRRVQKAGGEGRPNLDPAFSYDRSGMVKATLQETERSLSQNDLREETSRIMENAYDAVNTFLGTGAGAAGLGLVGGIILAVAPVVDVLGGFGLVTGAALAVLGASVLPRQRKKAIREFSDSVDELRDSLQSALREALEADVERTLDRVWSTAEPYESFVEKEREQLTSAEKEIEAIKADLSAMESRITTLVADTSHREH
jgi:small GTP-binding protein